VIQKNSFGHYLFLHKGRGTPSSLYFMLSPNFPTVLFPRILSSFNLTTSNKKNTLEKMSPYNFIFEKNEIIFNKKQYF
jgi:hypothetical protein